MTDEHRTVEAILEHVPKDKQPPLRELMDEPEWLGSLEYQGLTYSAIYEGEVVMITHLDGSFETYKAGKPWLPS